MATVEPAQDLGGTRAETTVGIDQDRQVARRLNDRGFTGYHDLTRMAANSRTVKHHFPADDPALPAAERIRRRFAAAWSEMGVAWGVAPSTAAVQGYLLAHGGPVTDAELREALGLSHRAIRLALASCEEWGIVRRAEEPRRSGRRGPAGRAWMALDDHWEWFHRVIESRKEREGDPVIAILEQCLVEARNAGSDEELVQLEERLESLLGFVRQFDHGLSAVMRADTSALRKLFVVVAQQDEATLDHLLATLAEIPEDELSEMVRTLSRMPAGSVRNLMKLAGKPGVGRLIGARRPAVRP